MSLYQKHRPDEFSKIRGNSDTVEALTGMLSKPETCPHSFLLYGQTGCGKTTIARIIAKVLNVDKMDTSEIDSADFRGIDTIREIRKNCQFKALKSRYRVYILDEVQQLSKDAQSALLKILEDTPKHVFFILCTTDPQKLLPTLKARCSQFQVKPLEEIEMKGLLKKIAREENDSISKEVLEQIVLESQGLPRNAIQILEQVLNVEPEKRMEATKQATFEQSESISLCRALIGKAPWNTIKVILEGLKQQEPETIRRVVLGYAQSILLKSKNDRAALIIEEFLEPTYNSGFPQIVYACYTVCNN
jgi:DNA polymerase III subunit gamma/tau